jgi:hypothetical protein
MSISPYFQDADSLRRREGPRRQFICRSATTLPQAAEVELSLLHQANADRDQEADAKDGEGSPGFWSCQPDGQADNKSKGASKNKGSRGET